MLQFDLSRTRVIETHCQKSNHLMRLYSVIPLFRYSVYSVIPFPSVLRDRVQYFIAVSYVLLNDLKSLRVPCSTFRNEKYETFDFTVVVFAQASGWDLWVGYPLKPYSNLLRSQFAAAAARTPTMAPAYKLDTFYSCTTQTDPALLLARPPRCDTACIISKSSYTRRVPRCAARREACASRTQAWVAPRTGNRRAWPVIAVKWL